MAVPNEGTTALPSDSGSRYFIGLWDGTNFRAWRSDTNGYGKVLIVDTAGNALVKAEDAAHSSGDFGIMTLAVRQNAAAALAGTDADYAPLEVDANGRLHAILSASEKAEDAAHSSGDTGIMALAVRKDTAAALAGTDGDYAPLEVNAAGALHVATGVEKADDAAFTAGTSTVLPIAGNYQSTVDEVDAGDAGAVRITARRGIITAGDAKALAFTSGAPTPTGTDLTDEAGGALVSGDFQIRDTNLHGFVIPMSGWEDLTIQYRWVENFDQTVAVSVYVSNTTLYVTNILLAAFNYPSGTLAHFAIGNGGAVGQGGGTGGATVSNGAFYNIPALRGFSYVTLVFQAGVAPSTGNFSLFINRRA